MAAQGSAQNAACAANLQIPHGDAKTRPQRAILFDGANALARSADCHHFARQKQIRVCLVLGSADASTQLIQIGEAKLIRAIDDDRVCIRNVETAFDDCRANEHVRFSGNESRHHRFQFVCVHLAMPDFDSGLGAKMKDPITCSFDGRDAIVQKENLTLPFQFAINCGANDSLIVG